MIGLQHRERVERKAPPLDFDDVAFDVWSDTGEDGILLYIFSHIGFATRRCIDIGSGALRGSNVANLLVHHAFDGLLVDANEAAIQQAEAAYAELVPNRPPKCISTRVTRDGLDGLVERHGFAGEVDLFCLDIDGIDYWIWDGLKAATPRVVVVEYQDILGPERAWTVPYDPSFDVDAHPVNRERRNYCGASLRAFAKLADQRGYRLVGCNVGGWNAFFVRRELAPETLPEVTVESCFRYPWNRYGMKKRFPLVADMPWQDV